MCFYLAIFKKITISVLFIEILLYFIFVPHLYCLFINSTLDGIARATGGLPHSIIAQGPHLPAPPKPPVAPLHFSSNYYKSPASNSRTLSRSAPIKNNIRNFQEDSDSGSSVIVSNRKKWVSPHSSVGRVSGRRVAWPSSTIPKKVKKLSWEDELNIQVRIFVILICVSGVKIT